MTFKAKMHRIRFLASVRLSLVRLAVFVIDGVWHYTHVSMWPSFSSPAFSVNKLPRMCVCVCVCYGVSVAPTRLARRSIILAHVVQSLVTILPLLASTHTWQGNSYPPPTSALKECPQSNAQNFSVSSPHPKHHSSPDLKAAKRERSGRHGNEGKERLWTSIPSASLNLCCTCSLIYTYINCHCDLYFLIPQCSLWF